MTPIEIQTLGELAVYRDGEALKLPASKRARNLLAYLALSGQTHRRDRLCELLWDVPDDPRAALRWALSKIRPLVNDPHAERLIGDRERVGLDCSTLRVDVQAITEELVQPDLPLARLEALASSLKTELLAGADLPDQALFQDWLTAEREEVNRRLRGRVLQQLAVHPDLPPDRALSFAVEWSELEPFSTEAAAQLLARLSQLGRTAEFDSARATFSTRFQKAGVPWTGTPVQRPESIETNQSNGMERLARQFQARQKIRFCTSTDSVNIAYATVGDGPPLVKAANWLSHLQHDWDAPIWSPLLRDLAQYHQVVRYDERGNGLSDWAVQDISQEAFVADLECVVNACSLEQFALLGISQGAAVSIEYAVRHPERVRCLILFGGYPAGWRINATQSEILEREAVMTLTATGWGRDNPAYRHIFSSTFMPSATAEEMAWFDEFQRMTTSPENAVRFLSAFGDIDVRDKLAQISVPTLVIHALGDRRIPVSVGRSLAASIPGAEFVCLDSDGHLLLGREPASKAFVEAVREFLARCGASRSKQGVGNPRRKHEPQFD